MKTTNKFIFFFALIILMVQSSCVKQENDFSDTDSSQLYALVSINGKPVPAYVLHQGTDLQVLSGTFFFRSDGTCNSKTIFVPPSGTKIVRDVTAIYIRDGSSLTMQWKGAGITIGTIQNNTFTMDNEGMVFVYEK